MKNRFLVCLFLPFLLASCATQAVISESNESVVEEEESAVGIVNPEIEDFYGGTNLKLNVNVTPANLELAWSSSDETVATVNNGVVTFKDVNEKKDVTIKAASTKNQQIFDELECEVKPNPIDLDASDGYNASNFYTTGMALSANTEKILFNNDASSTFFYKASFNAKLTEATGEFGFYLYTSSSAVENAFLTMGVDGRGRMQEGGFPYLVIKKGDEVSKVTLSYDGAFKEGVYRDLAIGKYEKDLYIFGENQKTLLCAEKFFDTFEENQQFKVGIYTKGFAVSAKDFRASLNENDLLFGEPTTITLGEDKTVLQGEEFDLQVRGNRLNLHPLKLTYASTNEDIATVNSRGHVVTVGYGDVTLKARYDNKLQTSMNLHVDKLVTVHTFELNEGNAPASYDGDVSINDSDNQPLIFNYVGASTSAGNHMALADGGYIANKEALLDLTNLIIAGTGTFKLHTGFEGYEHVKTFTLNDESNEFALSNISYFKLEAVGEAVVKSINGTTNNQETEGKDLELSSVGDSPMFDVVGWNILVHDVDTSKDFTYTVSFRQITNITHYLHRPAFFVFPAEYDEDDEIVHTTEQHFFAGTGGYLHIRQANSQLCHKTKTNSEQTVCKSGSWIDDHVTGTKATTEGGLWGLPGEEGTTTTNSRITRNCILTLTFSLKNYYEGEVRYQKWFLRIDCESFAVISNIDYSGNYSKTYTLETTVAKGGGNIFPCERIGLAIAHHYEGTYKILSASSTGVRA